MANDIPEISRGARTPITSAGGSGGAGLGGINYETSTTPDMTGVGAALGALGGALMAAKGAGGAKAGDGKGSNAIDRAQKAVEELNRTIPVYDSEGRQVGTTMENAEFTPPGGYPSRDTPTMDPYQATQNIQFPPGTTQSEIDLYAPGYVISGVNMSNGNVVATPNLKIGGGTLFGTGSVNFEDRISPTGKYETDAKGNIYDPNGELYAIKNAGEGFTVKVDVDKWINSANSKVYSTDELLPKGGGGYDPTAGVGGIDFSIGPDFSKFERGQSADYTGGGYDPSQDFMPSLDEGVQTFPYDFSNELSSGQMTDLMGGTSPTIDISGFNPSDLFGGDFLDSFTPSFDTSSLFSGIGDTFSNIGSSIGDFFDFGSLFAKDGGHIKGYADGGSSVGTTLTGAGIGGGLGALLGALLSGQSTGKVSRGVDMSKVGVINPRTTSFGVGPARFAPYSQYTTTPPAMPFDYSKLMRNLGMGMADGGSASYYTFGTPVNPSEVMRGSAMPAPAMKSGGLPKATAPMTMEGRHDYRHGQYVDGVGDGQSDDIPAMLADGEYVIDSDTVAALGNGSNKAGAKLLDGMRKQIRAHKRSAPIDKIPPKAKSPLEYMRMGAMKKGAK